MQSEELVAIREKMAWVKQRFIEFRDSAHIVTAESVTGRRAGKVVGVLLNEFMAWLENREASDLIRSGRRFRIGERIFTVQDTNVVINNDRSERGMSAKSKEGWGVCIPLKDAMALSWIEEEPTDDDGCQTEEDDEDNDD